MKCDRKRRSGAAILIGSAALALAACGGSSGASSNPPLAPEISYGLDAVTDLASLPVLRPPGQRTAQVSSYDRTGGNIDPGLLGQFP